MKNFKFVMRSALATLTTMIMSSSTSAQSFVPDHYLSYDIKTVSGTVHQVSLRDQFIDWTDFYVGKPIKLLNPTVKRHNNEVHGINNPELHYTAYRIRTAEDVEVTKSVVVTNQFGTFTLDTFRPERLLAPSKKRDLSPFELAGDIATTQLLEADHYLCYEIPEFEVATNSGFLKDQFRGREFENLIARRFCNPVAKVHDDRKFDIINDVENNHLMCFEIDKKRILRIVALFNQFGVKKALVVNDDELCVPSVKLEIPTECQGSTPDEEGVCNGVCPNENDVCSVDATGGSCTCVPEEPVSCFDGTPDNGVCNGQCPDGGICLVNIDNRCQCIPTTFPCSISPDGECGGFCPPDQGVCDIVPGTSICGCI